MPIEVLLNKNTRNVLIFSKFRDVFLYENLYNLSKIDMINQLTFKGKYRCNLKAFLLI